jgi:phosphoribosylformylglycinamidine cyclo-ligase
VGAALLEPTILYVKPVLELISRFGVRTGISGLAHITGGGLIDNTVRILPEGVRLVFDRSSWAIPPLFQWLQELGNIDTEEMYKVFNMGIGFCVIVRPKIADSVVSDLHQKGIRASVIGRAESGAKGAEYGSIANS